MEHMVRYSWVFLCLDRVDTFMVNLFMVNDFTFQETLRLSACYPSRPQPPTGLGWKQQNMAAISGTEHDPVFSRKRARHGECP